MLTSCGCGKEVVHTNTVTEVRDSVVYIENVRFDTIRIPAEKVSFKTPVSELKDGFEKKETNGRATASVFVANNELNVSANCDELETIIASKDKEIRWFKSQETSTTAEPIYKVSNSKFAVFCIWYSCFLTAVVGIYIYIKIRNHATRS